MGSIAASFAKDVRSEPEYPSVSLAISLKSDSVSWFLCTAMSLFKW